jgi:hypothetical protein
MDYFGQSRAIMEKNGLGLMPAVCWPPFAGRRFLSYSSDVANRSSVPTGVPMSYALPRRAPAPLYPAGDVRFEYGWLDIQSGFAKILQGYAVLIVGLGFCAFLVVASVVKIINVGAGGKLPLGSLWLFYLGIGLPTVIIPIGYGLIAVGKWRCLMSAPERFHCRWLMFACMACLLMGPAINLTSSFTGLQTAPELKRGPEGFRQMKFTALGGALQIASAIIGFGSLVLFVLFLRAVARCFEDQTRIWLANLYLIFFGGLMAATVYVGFRITLYMDKPVILMALGAGWLLVFLGYLFLVMTMRSCIRQGLAGMRSPFDAELDAPSATGPERAWPVV